ncbi:MAG: M16 family metallopeptidase [Janthinobacterium lividum]
MKVSEIKPNFLLVGFGAPDTGTIALLPGIAALEGTCPLRVSILRSHLLLSLTLAALAALSPHKAQGQTVTTPTSTATGVGLGTITEYTLANGLQVLIAPSDAADLVTMDVWVGAGTRRETAENNGVAHFMEHLIFKGTPTRKPGEIDAAIENLGGTLNAATSYDWAHFYGTVDSADTPAALAILSDALMNSQMRQADIDAEKPVILSEMARDTSSATERVSRVYNALTFPDHPYGRPLLGTAHHVSDMSRQTILEFYHTYYAPANATLILAGKITPEAGLALAQKDFGAWPVRAVPNDKTLPEEPQTTIREQNLTAPVSHGFLQIGFHAPSVQDKPDAWIMDVLMTLLGQGGNNRLEQDLEHKQKLVRAISTNYLTQRDPGTMSVAAEFEPGDYAAVRTAILGEISALRDTPVSDAEINAAKHTLLASYLFDTQTNSGRADALGFYSRIDSYKYDTEYVGHFESVTPTEVQTIAHEYFNLSAYTVVTLLPPPDPITASRH